MVTDTAQPRIHFTYRHIDAPWGGANNFIRALRTEMQQSGEFVFADSPESPCDIIFMNQLGTGPGGAGKRHTLADVRRWKDMGKRIVVRAVNLNAHAFRLGFRNLTIGRWQDRQTIALLNLADWVIFQSEYQLRVFRKAGYLGNRNQVIHNGAPPIFWIERPQAPPSDGTLRLVSSTASPRPTKRHDLIAKLSLCNDVEVSHMGAWPKNIPTAKVRLLGTLKHSEMINELSRSHYFLHAAIKDPCPNSVFEAVCAGLPVIFNNGPGSSAEIVGPCGLALDESDIFFAVSEARRRVTELRATVLVKRNSFTIQHAAAKYLRAFGRVMNMAEKPQYT
ncbi:MAG: hypothetical protein ACK4FK_05645 [Ferrovibrio sp.]|uniref:hypothetical protein n=1 Tax=Ferrovibrio sp. TaxID=1917215 RepID=UPI00391B71D3